MTTENTTDQTTPEKPTITPVVIGCSDLLASFQYYDGGQCIEDTGLITLDEAQDLWEKYKEDFSQRAMKSIREDGEHVEMCVWKNMNHECNYRDQDKYAHSGDMKIINGDLYVVTPFIS